MQRGSGPSSSKTREHFVAGRMRGGCCYYQSTNQSVSQSVSERVSLVVQQRKDNQSVSECVSE